MLYAKSTGGAYPRGRGGAIAWITGTQASRGLSPRTRGSLAE